MLDNLIITNSYKIISTLKKLGFTKFEKFQGEIYINDLHYSHAMRNIRIALREDDIDIHYGQLVDVVTVLAANNADLETGKNANIDLIPPKKQKISQRKIPQTCRPRGF